MMQSQHGVKQHPVFKLVSHSDINSTTNSSIFEVCKTNKHLILLCILDKENDIAIYCNIYIAQMSFIRKPR